MGSRSESDASSVAAISSIQSIVVVLAAEIREDSPTAAEHLESAAAINATPAERLLVLREALIATRPDWELPGVNSSSAAIEALKSAKRLAIEL